VCEDCFAVDLMMYRVLVDGTLQLLRSLPTDMSVSFNSCVFGLSLFLPARNQVVPCGGGLVVVECKGAAKASITMWEIRTVCDWILLGSFGNEEIVILRFTYFWLTEYLDTGLPVEAKVFSVSPRPNFVIAKDSSTAWIVNLSKPSTPLITCFEGNQFDYPFPRVSTNGRYLLTGREVVELSSGKILMQGTKVLQIDHSGVCVMGKSASFTLQVLGNGERMHFEHGGLSHCALFAQGFLAFVSVDKHVVLDLSAPDKSQWIVPVDDWKGRSLQESFTSMEWIGINRWVLLALVTIVLIHKIAYRSCAKFDYRYDISSDVCLQSMISVV
jgi:hypothetical protein